MPLNNQILTSKPSLLNAFEALRENINYNLNCVKVAIVDSFDADTLTVACRVANKRVIALKKDGNQVLQDYPLIYAKVHFFGWGNVGATYPITKGMEGILLFNDREIETWFLTGDGGNLAYDRNHSLSDALFICGIHSVPTMIQIMLDCLHLYYGNSDIQIKENAININSTAVNVTGTTNITGATNISGRTIVTGALTATNLGDESAVQTASFKSLDNKTVTVIKGIITKIEEED